MISKVLENTFINLGIEAGNYMANNISEIIDKNKMIPFDDKTKLYYSKINDVFNKLVLSSFDENYFFYGCSFKVFINEIEAKKKEYINLALGKTEKVYYDKAWKLVSDIHGILLSENPIFYNTLITHTTRFNNRILKGNEDKFKAYYFLSKENKIVIERNFDEIFRYLRSKPDNIAKSSYLIEKREIDLDLWNKDCHNLFHYLYENFVWSSKETMQSVNSNKELPYGIIKRLTDIYHYLRESLEGSRYEFRGTKDKYKSYIKSEFNIMIANNFEKTGKFIQHINTMKDFTESFEKLH
ncbi:hypothetical protein [Winogradskyella poriferorum]|uniref:hypothetical protein n=1 Tax=Winogradskyella poriferorum TaxID=307627 RepID=UPI003D651FDD